MLMKNLYMFILLAIFATERGDVKKDRAKKLPARPQVKIDTSLKGNFNYEVCVKLRNGGRMYGVVLQGVLFETLRKRGFKPVDNWKASKTGIRLWYVNDQKGYVYIPYSSVEEVSRLKVVSEEEMKRILERIAEKEKEARKAREQAKKNLDEKKKEESEEAELASKKKEEQEKKNKTEDMKKIIDERLALFKKYHPEKGWTPEKRKYLKWRGPIIGVFPSDEEREFLDNYDNWYVIYKEWKSEQDEEEAAEKGGENKEEKKEEEGEKESTGEKPKEEKGG